MSKQDLNFSAFANQPGDMFATVYDGRHLLVTDGNGTVRSDPNYMTDRSNQVLKTYYIDPQIAGSTAFSDKTLFFKYLLENARVRIRINISQALRRAALQMQMMKMI
jgi:hypothetical protein